MCRKDENTCAASHANTIDGRLWGFGQTGARTMFADSMMDKRRVKALWSILIASLAAVTTCLFITGTASFLPYVRCWQYYKSKFGDG